MALQEITVVGPGFGGVSRATPCSHHQIRELTTVIYYEFICPSSVRCMLMIVNKKYLFPGF